MGTAQWQIAEVKLSAFFDAPMQKMSFSTWIINNA